MPGLTLSRLSLCTTTITFEDFWRSEHVSVARALAFTLGDVQLAAEAADEAMARAFQHWARVGTLDSPAGWTYRVGLNWSRSVLRRVRRRPPAWLAQPNTHHDVPMLDPSIAAALRELSAGQRAVVSCRMLLNHSELQTATMLRIRPGTVKSRLSRALAQLSTSLAQFDPKEQQP
jgi:RNA polymerase sigma-70 factor (ECF subfamily)